MHQRAGMAQMLDCLQKSSTWFFPRPLPVFAGVIALRTLVHGEAGDRRSMNFLEDVFKP